MKPTSNRSIRLAEMTTTVSHAKIRHFGNDSESYPTPKELLTWAVTCTLVDLLAVLGYVSDLPAYFIASQFSMLKLSLPRNDLRQ